MSMIELVIAIVVMGIVVASLPLILLQSQRSTTLSLEQEVILATKSRLAFILSHEWDVNSYDANASLSRVLNTNSDPEFNTNSTRRSGHVDADGRRRLRDDMLAPTVTTNANWRDNNLSDIDDFDNRLTTVIASASDMDYTFTKIDLNSTVSYVSDALTIGAYANQNVTFTFTTVSQPNPTNIKMITINAHAEGATTSNITLRAFASNIGESAIMRKTW